MGEYIFAFIAGNFIGGVVGVTISACCVLAGREERRMEEAEKIEKEEN